MKKLLTKLFVCMTAAAFAMPLAACNDEDEKVVHIYMPDGAPAVALAGLMNSGYDGAKFTVVKADEIAAQVSSGKADMAIMPVNAAAKLYNKGVDIVMMSVNTHGNLYIVGDSPVSELSELAGSRLGVIGQGNVPDLTLRMLLDDAEISYEVSENQISGKIALRYAGSGGELLPMLGAGHVDYALLAEPAATNAVAKFNKTVAADIQQMWQSAFDSSYPQACLVAKGSLIKERREFAEAFLSAVKDTDGWAETNPDKAVAAVKSHVASGIQSELGALTSDIVRRCNIRTVYADDSREDCTAYFTLLTQLHINDTLTALDKVPDTEFYYSSAQA